MRLSKEKNTTLCVVVKNHPNFVILLSVADFQNYNPDSNQCIGLLAMNLIKAIKDFFAPAYPDESGLKLYVRRGTLAQIKSAKPHYVGEMVLCLDKPFLAIGTADGYELIKLNTKTKAVKAIRSHYSDPEWIVAKPTW